MSFALVPAWLGWSLMAAAAVAAAGVFLLRPKPVRHVVSSLVVWSRVFDAERQRSVWERLRWIVSLLLTVAVAVAIGAALLQPIPAAGTSQTPRVLIVLDSSWTMQAKRSAGGTRWDEAVREARWILASGHEVAIATTGEGIVDGPTTDRRRLSATLSRLTPSGAPDGAWPRLADAGAAHLITDGATGRLVEPDVLVHSVFEPADNVAISAFDVDGETGSATAFIAVSNYGRSARTVQVSIVRDQSPVLQRTLQLGAGDTFRETVAVPLAGAPRFLARAVAPGDALPVDDEAEAWLWRASPVSVAVVGNAGAVPGMLAQDPHLRVNVVDPAHYGETSPDVWVFGRWLPASRPAAPALVIDPPAGTWLGGVTRVEGGGSWQARVRHPILNGVDGTWFRTSGTARVDRPDLQPLVVTGEGAPLVSAVDQGWRAVIFGFSLEETNIGETPAFPVLVGNSIDWLAYPDRGRSRPPGPVLLPAETRRVVSPTGTLMPVARRGDAAVAVLDRPGLYLAEQPGGPARVLSVALGDRSRSNLHQSSVAVDRERRGAAPSPGNDWWRMAGAFALAVMVVEWFLWQSRVTV